ncbi:arsenic resistance N-acetyltransferase ArsN2 [Natrinema salsiterrestre]|uniref:Arsenic resistance N-acetyltransferase ArsN2 n=1 Tax=Natrinema salsiterrestre TaxID=2950540 RepID=A0A9Q4L2T3_9EURY|nr:arsenic resistance N-acetyltransferase ArsN2 [Natrinema salsiterrestre]MDF9745452.1 arsenic resistance N-acetyltransferase ArsN2 [Natrinema salsiterrestre]
MTDVSITLRPVDAETVERVEALLKANDLPYRDVRTKPECFVTAFSETTFVGVGGVERYGSNGLLRSVVVMESNRGQGYGTALVGALEDRGRSNGVETLYLLTTTASAFFRREGYDAVDREVVPEPIQQTTEFADLCPNSAICLKKNLE